MQDSIQALSDDTAIRILTTIAQAQLHTENYQAELTPEIRQALQEEVPSSPSGEPSDAGELARQALLLLAEDPGIGPNLEQLIENPPPESFGPVTIMAVTVAALIALQTHVKFERKPSGKWKLLIEKKPTQEGLLKALFRGILDWKG